MGRAKISGIASCSPELSFKSKSIVIIVVIAFSLVLAVPASATQQFEWSKTYPDSQGQSNSVIATSDGGFAIAGKSTGKFLFAKVDSAGELVWWKTYQTGEAQCVIQTNDGGYALAGSGDVNFIKTDSSGNVQWSKSYVYSNETYKTTTVQIQSIVQTHDGGYVLAGKTPSGPLLGWDWTIKIDSQGNIIWGKTYGTHWGNSLATNILKVDGGYILAANSELYKLSENGDVLWSQPVGIGYALIGTTDGGYLLAVGGNAGSTKLVKTDSEGKTQWSKTYTLESARESMIRCVAPSSEGGFIVGGMAFPVWESAAWIIKIDSGGNQQWDLTSETIAGHNVKVLSIAEVSGGGYVFAGEVESINNNEYSDVWVAKISSSTPSASSSPSTQETSTPTQNSIQTPTPTPIANNEDMNPTLLITITTVALVTGLSLLVYFKKYKH